MSVRRLAPEAVQPKEFAFTPANDDWANGQIAKYPKGREASAVIPLLWMAQEQAGGWLPQKAIEAVGRKLGMPYMRVFEIATFYTMFNLAPAGEHFVQVCGTVPCHLKGAREIIKVCEDKIGPQSTVSADGKLSWLEVECLGACCNAPMVQINYDYYEDLTPENFAALLDNLRAGKPVKTGPQVDRSCSEPLGGGETLKDKALYDGSAVGRGDWQARVKADREAAKKAAEAAEAAKAAAAAAPTQPPATPVLSSSAPAALTPAALTPAALTPATSTPAASRPVTGSQPTNASQDTPAAGGAAIKGATTAAEVRKDAADAGQSAAAVQAVSDADKPAMLNAPRGGAADDLCLIWGVGPILAKKLNGMGVYHFDQIAAWTPKELAWVDAHLEGFKGRAVRDSWVDQSKKLTTGWRPDSKLGERPKGR
jgi:NADH-quinone oxidoreductase subunit E